MTKSEMAYVEGLKRSRQNATNAALLYAGMVTNYRRRVHKFRSAGLFRRVWLAITKQI